MHCQFGRDGNKGTEDMQKHAPSKVLSSYGGGLPPFPDSAEYEDLVKNSSSK